MPNNESTNAPIEYEFPWPNEEKGYALFPKELETDPLVLFHGTAKENLGSIIKNGFKARPPLESVSYAKNSVYCLTHVCQKRNPPQRHQEDDVIIAVRFETLDTQGIENNTQDIHVYKPELQPAIIAYVTVPHNYEHK
jgi:RNA:NAD 2'-phosphotransferase (TPT1/KptA family)